MCCNKCNREQLRAQVEESSYMEVSAQLEKVCIGSATALGERPDQQVMHQPCISPPNSLNRKAHHLA